MSEAIGYEANLRRGQVLRESGHYKEACVFLREAIQADPQEPQAYLELALALSEMPGGKAESLRAAERAVALAPNSAHFIGYRAYILAHLGLYKEALPVADSALRIDPNRHIALLARANTFTKTGQWPAAEQGARRMLELDAEDTGALNLLAQAMRFQNRHPESRDVIKRILALVPEDAFGQTNAGFEALNAGDHQRAHHHFVNALRVNPHSDNARRGLLQALRARVWFYRINLQAFDFVDRMKKKPLLLRTIVLVFSVATGGLFFLLWLLYLLLAFCLLPVSNLFLLFDPAGRHALSPAERTRGYFAGFFAVSLSVLFVVWHLWPLVILIWGYLALFALSVFAQPWLADWRSRREEKLSAAKDASSSSA
jgi:tetratricopeptide (TPR) repeat protein